MTRQIRIGAPLGALAALVLLLVVSVLYLWATAERSLVPLALGTPAGIAVASVAGVVVAAVVAFSVWTLRRARRLTPGTRGRARASLLALSSLLLAIGLVPASALLVAATRRALEVRLAIGFDLDQLVYAMLPGTEAVFYGAVAVATVGAAMALPAIAASWFLLPLRARSIVFSVLDALLAVGFVAVTLALPLEPSDDTPAALVGPGLRLAVTVLFVARIATRILGPVLHGLERIGFRTLVAARHLRAKKSNFLATIGTLSVLAVAFSSCSLTTTLSVMGGFRNDLKRKILGNTAHVVIDREHANFEGWQPLLETVRETSGVAAASPYVHAEVMLTSASNLSGAVLRGIDPKAIGQVTDLEKNLVRGKLEYLERPERLLDLPADERDGPVPLKSGRRRKAPGSDALPPEVEASGVLRDVDALLEDVGAGAAEGASTAERDPETPTSLPPKRPPKALEPLDDDLEAFLAKSKKETPREVLPGIIVGQELARTLRLYVGDEVSVVSPFGDLGPSGPMPKSRPFRVAGIFYSGMYEYDMKLSYVALPTAQRFLNAGDAISGIEIKVSDVERAPAIARTLRTVIERPELRVQDWQEANRNLFGALALEKLAMFITLGIAILVAGFCVFGTLTLMVQEKGREVGILKAMGAPSRSIVGLFLIEGLLIGFLGAAIGLGLGFLVCYAAEHFGIRMNPEVYYIDRLPVHLDPVEFAWVGAASALVCIVATIFPAIIASKLRPVDALRYE